MLKSRHPIRVEADQEIPQQITYFIEEHARARFGSVTVLDSASALATRQRVILRNAPFKSGDLFQSSLLSEYERRLYSTGLFTSVSWSEGA